MGLHCQPMFRLNHSRRCSIAIFYGPMLERLSLNASKDPDFDDMLIPTGIIPKLVADYLNYTAFLNWKTLQHAGLAMPPG